MNMTYVHIVKKKHPSLSFIGQTALPATNPPSCQLQTQPTKLLSINILRTPSSRWWFFPTHLKNMFERQIGSWNPQILRGDNSKKKNVWVAMFLGVLFPEGKNVARFGPKNMAYVVFAIQCCCFTFLLRFQLPCVLEFIPGGVFAKSEWANHQKSLEIATNTIASW